MSQHGAGWLWRRMAPSLGPYITGTLAGIAASAAGLFAASVARQLLMAVSSRKMLCAAKRFSLHLRRDLVRHAAALGSAQQLRYPLAQVQFLTERDSEQLTESVHRGLSQVPSLCSSVVFATPA